MRSLITFPVRINLRAKRFNSVSSPKSKRGTNKRLTRKIANRSSAVIACLSQEICLIDISWQGLHVIRTKRISGHSSWSNYQRMCISLMRNSSINDRPNRATPSPLSRVECGVVTWQWNFLERSLVTSVIYLHDWHPENGRSICMESVLHIYYIFNIRGWAAKKYNKATHGWNIGYSCIVTKREKVLFWSTEDPKTIRSTRFVYPVCTCLFASLRAQINNIPSPSSSCYTMY